MDFLSQLASLLVQTRVQAASIATLSSKVDDLTSVVTRLSAESAAQASTLAHLSSENARLRQAQRDQCQVNAELLRKAVPDGVMLWEGSEGNGTRSDQGKWVWSAVRLHLPAPALLIRPSLTRPWWIRTFLGPGAI